MAVETQFLPNLDPAGVVALTRFRATATAAIRPALCASTRRYTRWRATMWCGVGCPSP